MHLKASQYTDQYYFQDRMTMNNIHQNKISEQVSVSLKCHIVRLTK